MARALHSHYMILITEPDGAQCIVHKNVDKGGLIEEVSVAEAAGSAQYTTVNLADAFSPELIAERARAMLGRAGYDLLFANCEHFTTWCATDDWESQQVEWGVAAIEVALLMLSSENKTVRNLGAIALISGGITWLKTRPEIRSNDGYRYAVNALWFALMANIVFDQKELAQLGAFISVIFAALGLADEIRKPVEGPLPQLT